MTISVIIPAIEEQERINGLIRHLRQMEPDIELIVIDGDSNGSTIAAITDPKVICITAAKGRGNQLAAGAAVATGDLILMLHADTILPDSAFKLIQQSLINGADWGAFRLGIDSNSISYRIIELMVDLRCRIFKLPYGDQAIFVTSNALQSVGGVPCIPLMEDVELARRLHHAGLLFALLPDRVCTSPRRWQKDGITKRTFKNLLLLLRYFAGVNPDELAKEYR